MRSVFAILVNYGAVAASLAAPYLPHPHPAYIHQNPSPISESWSRIPTSYESAVLGRRILALTKLGTLATVFPPDANDRQQGLGGMPHGLPEYITDCEDDDTGNPTLLAITIATSFRNAAAGSNVSLAVQWAPRYPPVKRLWPVPKSAADHVPDPMPYSAANLPRFSLLGHVLPIPGGDDRSTPGSTGTRLAECFVDRHPDARYWLPGGRVHESHFVRLVVEKVYWVGGFGDRAYIGWIPVDEWRSVTRDEWESVTLPGEKEGWREDMAWMSKDSGARGMEGYAGELQVIDLMVST
jgi:hypothetical protein